MQIILYSTNCPMCKLLEQKLKAKNIQYSTIKDENIMLAKGFEHAPVLEVEGKDMYMGEAMKWLEAQH
jgi:glutaredoxin